MQVVPPEQDIITRPAILLSAGNTEFSAYGIPGLGYILQTATDLEGTWTDIPGTILAGPDGKILVNHPSPTLSRKFYRFAPNQVAP